MLAPPPISATPRHKCWPRHCTLTHALACTLLHNIIGLHLGKKHFSVGYVNCRNIDLFKDLPTLVSKQTPSLLQLEQTAFRSAFMSSPEPGVGIVQPKDSLRWLFTELKNRHQKPKLLPLKRESASNFSSLRIRYTKEDYKKRLTLPTIKMHNKVRVIKSVYNQGRNRKSMKQITESRNRPEFVFRFDMPDSI